MVSTGRRQKTHERTQDRINKTWSSVLNFTQVLSLIPYPLTLDPYPLSLIPYSLSFILFTLSLIPLPYPLVSYPLVLFLSRNLGQDSSSSSSRCNCCCCYQAKVKSTLSPWPKTWSLTITGTSSGPAQDLKKTNKVVLKYSWLKTTIPVRSGRVSRPLQTIAA